MKDLQVFKSLLLRTMLVAMFGLSWSAQAAAFHTVHRVSKVFIDMLFQAGPGRTRSE